MAEFASATGFADCWCGCKAERHKLELSGGKLVHTRCNSCRCVGYEPRVDEVVQVDAKPVDEVVVPDEVPPASGFEELLAAEHEQHDPRGELLASVVEYLEAAPAAASSPPAEAAPERVEVLPAKLSAPKRRGRPPRTGAAAYAAPGEVLGSWWSYACQTCGSRRYEAHECCGRPAEPVTLTMTRGHGG
jgi:hypothetical protein